LVSQAGIGISLNTIRRDRRREHLKSFLAGNFFKTDTQVEAVIGKVELITPTFSQLESVAAT